MGTSLMMVMLRLMRRLRCLTVVLSAFLGANALMRSLQHIDLSSLIFGVLVLA